MAAKPNIPVSRKEMYLDVATGGSTELPSPVTLEEKYLAKIAGMTVDLPVPVPLKHKFLAKIAGMQIDVPTYTTSLPRIYAYLAKAAGQDVEIPQPVTREEMYWFDYCGGTPTPPEREYTGAVPVTFTADGTPLLDYIISGNEEHSGTPTPDNPITPEGCGDLETIGEKAGQYKIPISSAGQTTPIYLGEVQSTRKIKKWILTGDETFYQDLGRTDSWRFYSQTLITAMTNVSICTHFVYIGMNAVNSTDNIGFSIFNQRQFGCRCPKSVANTITEFKAYLQQQYANGTPVCVWYVLATPQTAVVNEPIRKIGDYADSISMEQAGVEIPTVNGSNTLDVDTTVKPSEVYIKYKGGPVAGSQTSSQSSAYAPAEASSQSESIDDINSNLLGKEEETE